MADNPTLISSLLTTTAWALFSFLTNERPNLFLCPVSSSQIYSLFCKDIKSCLVHHFFWALFMICVHMLNCFSLLILFYVNVVISPGIRTQAREKGEILHFPWHKNTLWGHIRADPVLGVIKFWGRSIIPPIFWLKDCAFLYLLFVSGSFSTNADYPHINTLNILCCSPSLFSFYLSPSRPQSNGNLGLLQENSLSYRSSLNLCVQVPVALGHHLNSI